MPADKTSAEERRDWRLLRYRLQLVIGILILLGLVVPAFVHSAAAIGTLRNIPALWLPEDMPIRKAFFRFVEEFSVGDTLVVSWPSARLEDPSIEQALDWLGPLSSELAGGVPAVERLSVREDYAAILNLSNGEYPFLWVRSGSQIVGRLMARPLNLSREAATRRLMGSLVGADGQQTCLILALAPGTSKHHKELLPLIRERIAGAVGVRDSEVALVGGLVDGAVIDGAAIRSIALYSIPSSLIAALLCFLCLRSLALSATVVSIAIISQGMSLAQIFYVGYDLNAVLMVLPSLVFILTISTGVHLSNYFYEAVAAMPGQSRVAIVQCAMRMGYLPCLLSALTTVVGLLSLHLVRVQPVQVFGVAASVSQLFSLGMLFLMLPGAMLLAGQRRVSSGFDHQTGEGATPRSKFQEFAQQAVEWPLTHRWIVFASFAVLTVVAASGLPRLKSTVRVPDMFAEDSQLNQDYQWFEDHVGPTLTGDLLITFDRSKDQEPLEKLEVIKSFNTALSGVDGVSGLVSGITFLPNVYGGAEMSQVTTRAVMRSMIRNESSMLYEFGFLRHSGNEEIWRLTFRLRQTETTAADIRLAAIGQQVDRVLKDLPLDLRPRVEITGHVVILQQTQQFLLEDLVSSFFAALGLIALFMSVMAGNVVGGLLSMVPNIIPTLVLFGAMGWLDSSLDIGSVMTASVALGIAVDDTLHMLAYFRASRQRGNDLMLAAQEALRRCGLAAFQTTLICGCSLAVYYASEFKPTQRFAIFMAVLLTMAWLGVAILLPAMMTSRMGRWLSTISNRRI